MESVFLSPILLAVLLASLAGSTHCVGMCGPFAILLAKNKQSRPQSAAVRIALYHLGRLLTYCLIGAVAGVTGHLFNQGGQFIGWQQTAAWFAGIGMIVFGMVALLSLFKLGTVHFTFPTAISSGIQQMYRWSNRRTSLAKPFTIGVTTAWLPCGWLYAFVFLAISTSAPLTGALVMLTFWLGTIPALSILSIGIDRLPAAIKSWQPYFTACVLIVSGMFTVSIRAYADFSSLNEPCPTSTQLAQPSIDDVVNQPRPCCHSTTLGE